MAGISPNIGPKPIDSPKLYLNTSEKTLAAYKTGDRDPIGLFKPTVIQDMTEKEIIAEYDRLKKEGEDIAKDKKPTLDRTPMKFLARVAIEGKFPIVAKLLVENHNKQKIENLKKNIGDVKKLFENREVLLREQESLFGIFSGRNLDEIKSKYPKVKEGLKDIEHPALEKIKNFKDFDEFIAKDGDEFITNERNRLLGNFMFAIVQFEPNNLKEIVQELRKAVDSELGIKK